MKKVFALVLALAMVLGMSTSAFAILIKDGDFGIKAEAKVEFDEKINRKTDLTASVTIGNSDVIDSGVAIVDAHAANVNVSVPSALRGVFSGVKVSDAVDGELVVTFDVIKTAPLGTFNVDLVLTGPARPEVDANQKNSTLTVQLRGEVVSGEATSGSSSSIPHNVRIKAINEDWDVDRDRYLDTIEGDASPVLANLVPEDFIWEYTSGDDKGEIVLPGMVQDWDDDHLKDSHLTNVGVRKFNAVDNSGIVEKLYIDGTDVKFDAVKYYTKTGATDCAFDWQLTFKDQRQGNTYSVDFTIENDTEEVSEDDDTAFTDGNIVVKADGAARNVEMKAGEGIYVTKNFHDGQKVYCRYSLELSAGDEKLFQEFAELDSVYTGYTTGVNSAGVTVRFDVDDTYFVYNENFELIGTTADEKLPFSNKYYLTTAKVNLAGTDPVEEEPAEEEESTPAETGNSTTGGGEAVVTNYNPNTGR
jgi:hypothetical protein